MNYNTPTIGPNIPYPGDEAFAKMLQEIGSPLTFPEVRAFLMGTITSTGNVPMQEVHNHILGGKESSFKTLGEAQDFMKAMMGLWNWLAAHQEEDHPFPLYPHTTVPSVESLKGKAKLRRAEICQFVKGLDAGGTDPNEFDEKFKKNFTFLAEGISILDGMIELLEKKLATNAAELKETKKNLKKMDESFADCIHRFVQGSKAIRLEKIMAMKEKEELKQKYRHVGRNDSCPCGSGIKFKKCCSFKIH